MATKAYELLDSQEAVAPSLFWFEIRNVLITNERTGRIDAEQTQRGLALLAALPIRLDHAANEATTLRLARQHRLAVYDASYLDLALRLSVAVATADRAMAKAARAENIPLIGG